MKLKDLINNKEAFTKFVKEAWPLIFPNKPLTDEKLNEILNDKETQERCLKANQVLEEKKKYKDKQQELIQKYGTPRVDKSSGKTIYQIGAGYLNRTYHLHLKVDGSAESEEYNQKYLEHISNPETTMQANMETINDLLNLDKTKLMPESPDEALEAAYNPEILQYAEEAFNIDFINSDASPEFKAIISKQKTLLENDLIHNIGGAYGNPMLLFAKDFDPNIDVNIDYKALKDYLDIPENKELFENYISEKGNDVGPSLALHYFTGKELAENKARVEYIRNNHLDPSLKTLLFTKNGEPVSALEGLDGLAAGDKSFEVTSIAPEVADEQIRNGISQSERINNYFREMQKAYTIGKTYDQNKPETILPARIAENLAKTMVEHLIEEVYDRLSIEDIQNVTSAFEGYSFRGVLLNGMNNLKNFKGVLPPEIKTLYDKHDLTGCKPKDIRAIMDFAKANPEANALMLAGMKDKYAMFAAQHFDFTTPKEYANLVDAIYKAGIDLNDKNLFVKSSEIKTFFNDISKQQVYKNQAVIDELKAANPEMAGILDKANEISAVGNELSTTVHGSIETDLGNANDRSLFNGTKTNFAEYSDFINGQNNFDYNKNLDKSEKFLSELNATTEAFSEENKAKLLDIYDYMDKAGLLPTGKIQGEEANKVYGLSKLADALNQVRSAVASKDVNQIKTAVENYEKTDEMMKGVYAKIATLGNDRFGGNIASARNGSFPPFYRNDIVKTSQMNQFWMLGNLAKETGVSFKEMLDHPMEAMGKMFEQMMAHGPEKEYVQNHSQAEIIKDLIDHEEGSSELDSKVLKGLTNMKSQFMRAVDGLAFFSDNEKLRNEIALKCDLYFTCTHNEIFNNKANAETFINYLTVEKEDVNLRKIAPGAENCINLLTCKRNEKFSPEAYMASGKTTMAKIAQRLVDCDAMNLNNPQVEEAIHGVASMALKEKSLAASDYMKDTMQKIADGQVSELTNADKMMIKAEISLNAGMAQKDLASSVTALSDVQKEYNSRNFILKLLGPKTRRMGAMLDASKAQVSEKFGVTVEKLNEHFKNPSVPLTEEVKETKPEEAKPEVNTEPVKQAVTRQALDIADPEFSALLDEEVNGRDRKMVVTSMEEVNGPDHSFEVEKDSQDLSSSM